MCAIPSDQEQGGGAVRRQGRRITITLAGPMVLSPYSRRLQRLGTCRLADEFFDLGSRTRRSVLRSYLVGHAFELYLKAFLMKQGMKVSELRNKPYGHDLAALLREAMKRGLISHYRVTPQLTQEVAGFSARYAGKSYEYFSILDFLFGGPLPAADKIWKLCRQMRKDMSARID